MPKAEHAAASRNVFVQAADHAAFMARPEGGDLAVDLAHVLTKWERLGGTPDALDLHSARPVIESCAWLAVTVFLWLVIVAINVLPGTR